MTIDDAWSLIGSANWDTRSFRLNFELNVEIQDEAFARNLMEAMPKGRPLTRAEIDGDRLPLRLRSNAARLLQPYL
jgi:cardiolipin synthase